MTPAQNDALAACAGRALTPDEAQQIDGWLEARRDDLIAALLSIGRTRPVTRLVGKGAVIRALGLTAANELLDIIDTHADFRHVKHLLTAGELDASDPLVSALLAPLVSAGVLTQPQADALTALGREPAPLNVADVSRALNIAEGRMVL